MRAFEAHHRLLDQRASRDITRRLGFSSKLRTNFDTSHVHVRSLVIHMIRSIPAELSGPASSSS